MSRNGFISDDLYNMRERFKRNAERQSPGVTIQPSAPEVTPDVTQEAASSAAAPVQTISLTPPSPGPENSAAETAASCGKLRLPGLSVNSADSETNRERRDLEGRLLRDLSFMEVEKENLLRELRAIEQFNQTVTGQLEELKNIDNANITPAEYAKSIDRMRILYFQSFGRFDARNSRRNDAPASGSGSELRFPSPWPLAAGIISAAVIVSLTLIFLFG